MSRRKHLQQPIISAQSSLDSALARFRPYLSPEGYSDLLEELGRPLYPALRANPLKCEPQAALDEWAQRYGWQTRPVPFCAAGRWVITAETPISQTVEHRLGFYYIQDAASMLPAELFDFDGLDSPLVLDLAASPGGKTTHLLARTGDRGLVLANDSSQDRITALRIVLQNWGAAACATTHFAGEKFGAWYPETFDRVLLDAPCSMQGLRASEGHPMRPVSERELTSLARRQVGLLESALQAVKVGGQVVYSTCTLSPEEDEGVLDALRKKYPGAFQVDDLGRRLDRPAPGLQSDGARRFDPAVANAARLWPQVFGTAGFFAARLTKCAALSGPRQEPPDRPIERAGFTPLGRREADELTARLADWYGLEVKKILEDWGVQLWSRDASIYAFPQVYFGRFSGLPVQSLGLLLGERAPAGFIPSHEWVARFGMRFTSGRIVLASSQVPAWLRGEDLPGQPGAEGPAGRIMAVFSETGQLLGRGKVSAGRLKNLSPKRITP